MTNKQLADAVNKLLANRRTAVASDVIDLLIKRCDSWADAKWVAQLVYWYFQDELSFKVPKKWRHKC